MHTYIRVLTIVHVEIFGLCAEDLPNVLQAIHGNPSLGQGRSLGLGATTLVKEIWGKNIACQCAESAHLMTTY